jgi:hypothetical protein
MKIMQGDAYPIKFKTTSFTVDEITSIEFTIGRIIKTYNSDGSGAVTYDSADQTYNFPITQSETFLMGTKQPVQLRVVKDGCVYGIDLGVIALVDSLSKNFLQTSEN